MSQTTVTLRDFFLAKLDREAVLVRKALERVPEGRNDFKPHERSMELGYLAALVAGILGWIALMIDRDELNIDDPSSDGFRTRPLAGQAELLASLDNAVAVARRALESTTDEHLLQPWAFKMNGNAIQKQPRTIMIADAVFSHLAHHRGQLTVYLRLVSSTVPALYGPSADERF
ncbi:MAG: DinB family protein [Terracidiphilus sp.]